MKTVIPVTKEYFKVVENTTLVTVLRDLVTKVHFSIHLFFTLKKIKIVKHVLVELNLSRPKFAIVENVKLCLLFYKI